jgi:hypothetical protein
MADVKCPYCDSDEDINHDDGYGYEENRTHTQECGTCGKVFTYTTTISFDYDVDKAPCQNGEPHKLVDIVRFPKEFAVGIKRCEWCDEEIMVDKVANEKASEEYWKSLKTIIN